MKELSDDELLAAIANGPPKPNNEEAQEDIEFDLASFTGTENWWKHSFGIVYTDGVKYLAERCKAYWLIDLIASYQREPQITRDRMLREFQLWILKVNRDSPSPAARAQCFRDTDDLAFEQVIEFTDFPLDSIKLYLEGGVLMLPSER